MQAPPPHPRETERLAALRALGLLDSPPEARFDALTRTACRLFHVPTALISLVDADRQWFKSRVGLEAPETPRDISFCGHAILSTDPFVVEDAGADARFCDNPLVAGELGLRFYAGAPLRDDGGLPYGTLCLLGYQPRAFTAEEGEALKDLALLAEAELKAAAWERTLGLDRTRLDALIVSMGEGVVFQDTQGVILSANASAERILGLSLDQLQGRASIDPRWCAVHEDGSPWPGDTHPSMTALRTGRPDIGQIMGVPTPEGGFRWLLVNAHPVPNLDGGVGGVVCAFLDITARKVAEAALRESEERYLHMAANVPGLLYQSRVTASGVPELLYVSDYSRELYGVPPEAILANPEILYRWTHPDDVPALNHARQESRTTGLPLDHVWRMVLPSGQVKWLRSQARGSPQADGGTLWNGLVLDLTERIETELAMRDSQARSQALVEALPDMIFLIHRDGRLLEVHAHSEAGLRRPKEDLLGRTFHELMPKEAADERMALIHRVLATGRMETYESRVEALGGVQDHESRVVPCGPDTVLLIARDITERKAMDRMKAEFVSTVSHELRTPITSIRGALGLLEAGVGGEIPAKGLDLLDIARANTERLLRLVNDILDFEKAQAGQLTLDVQTLNLAELIGASVLAAGPFGTSLDVAYHWTAPDHPAWAKVDASRFQQIMANLLSNAAKYSPSGHAVKVRLFQTGGQWRVEVENEGPPIPASFRAQIFERFAMADATDARHRSGTGLGLAISRSLVQRMGGRIDFTSGPEGTCFFLLFPAEAAP